MVLYDICGILLFGILVVVFSKEDLLPIIFHRVRDHFIYMDLFKSNIPTIILHEDDLAFLKIWTKMNPSGFTYGYEFELKSGRCRNVKRSADPGRFDPCFKTDKQAKDQAVQAAIEFLQRSQSEFKQISNVIQQIKNHNYVN